MDVRRDDGETEQPGDYVQRRARLLDQRREEEPSRPRLSHGKLDLGQLLSRQWQRVPRVPVAHGPGTEPQLDLARALRRQHPSRAGKPDAARTRCRREVLRRLSLVGPGGRGVVNSRSQSAIEPQGGIEPPTCALPRRRSTPKPLRQRRGPKDGTYLGLSGRGPIIK